MTSIYAYRTITAPRVMPPKPEIQTAAPKLSMAEDAARCNARLRRTGGATAEATTKGGDANAVRIATAKARDERVAWEVHALLRSQGPMSRAEMARASGMTMDVARRVLIHMQERGMINRMGTTHMAKWEAVE